MGCVILVTASPIIRVFNSQADAEVLRLGILCVRAQCLVLWIHAWGSTTNMFYGGIGKAKEALLMSTARQGYCFIPVALAVPALLGVAGIATTQAIADLVSLVIIIPLTLRAKRLIRENEQSL